MTMGAATTPSVPESFKKMLVGDALASVYDVLGPPPAERLQETFEIEVEAEGEGTFTIHYDDGVLSGEKGYADDPFCSIAIPDGGWPTIAALLDAALAGFGSAPTMARRQKVARALKRSDLDAAFQGIARLKDTLIAIQLGGVGTFRIARGSLDEATRELEVRLPEGALDDAIAGGSDAFTAAKVGGDRRLQGELLAALGQVWIRIKSA